MKDDNGPGISRREFAYEIAAVAACTVIAPAAVAAQTEKAATPLKPPQPEEGLSPAAKAEAELNYQAVLQKYGKRLSEEQKTDVRRLLMQQQKSIEAVRAYPLENGNEPSLVLHTNFSEVR